MEMINPTQVNWSHLTPKRKDDYHDDDDDDDDDDEPVHPLPMRKNKTFFDIEGERSLSDEDYIIFCCRKDGAFEVVKNNVNKPDNHDQLPLTSSGNSRPVNRKLNYGDNTKTKMIERCNNDNESLTGKLAHEVYPKNYGHKMVDENIYLDSRSVCGGNFEEHRHSSNASSGSFAFPVLGWECSGSPERMPKTERLRLRKHKARCLVFQCCTF